jgi:hypothetical protein
MYIYIYWFDLGAQFDTFSHTKSTTLVAWSDISAASCPTAIPQHLSLSHHREELRLEPQQCDAVKFDLSSQKCHLCPDMRQHSSQKLDSANRSMGFQTSAALCIKFFSHSSDGFASGCTNKDQQRTSHCTHLTSAGQRVAKPLTSLTQIVEFCRKENLRIRHESWWFDLRHQPAPPLLEEGD